MARPVLLASSLLLAHGVALAQSTPPPPDQWAQYNRYVEVAAGVQQQDYREQDISGLTTDGVLDTETGRQSAFGAALRWQTDSGWLVQLKAQRQSGATDYSGYLQTGNGSHIPYQVRTGNVAEQFRINLDHALNASTWPAMPERWQLTPLVQVGWHHWQRNLVHYAAVSSPKRNSWINESKLRAVGATAPNVGYLVSQGVGRHRRFQPDFSQGHAV